jgi:hypothetical protein
LEYSCRPKCHETEESLVLKASDNGLYRYFRGKITAGRQTSALEVAKAEDRPTRTLLLLDWSGGRRGRHEDRLEVERSSSGLSPEARLSRRTGDPGRERPYSFVL